jgi:hypothetical protein
VKELDVKKQDDAPTDYEDGQIVLVTHPAKPLPPHASNDDTPPFDVEPMDHAA